MSIVEAKKQAGTFDLAIIGGGPAGSSAAITAARAGARVLLLERGRLPRQRVCGEFVSAESLDLLADLLKDSNAALLSNAPQIAEGRLFFDGHMVSTPVDPPGASIARYDLDLALWRAAVQGGARAELEITVDHVSGEGPFKLSTSRGEFCAQTLIDASGRWSNLRERNVNGKSNVGNKWLGLKAHYAEDRPNPSVDLYFFEGGYCGVQPVALNGIPGSELCVNVCAMVRSDVARTLPEVFDLDPALLERSRAWRALMEPVTTSPLFFREPQPTRSNILQAGDAAGFVDPFVGDGISLALRSGALAAQCLEPAFGLRDTLAGAAATYSDAYSRDLLPVFRSSSKLRRLLNLPRSMRHAVGHLLEATPVVPRLLVRLTR